MRIIAGTSGGIPIKVPRDTTRPTTDRVRESIFSSLGQRVLEAKVLDLFAGSGSLGMECLSRGAEKAVFVEQSRPACEVINANLAKTKLADQAEVRPIRVDRFLAGLGPARHFDLIFADPPYARDEARATALSEFLNLPGLAQALGENGILILETFSRVALPGVEQLEIARERITGDTRITWHKASQSAV